MKGDGYYNKKSLVFTYNHVDECDIMKLLEIIAQIYLPSKST